MLLFFQWRFLIIKSVTLSNVGGWVQKRIRRVAKLFRLRVDSSLFWRPDIWRMTNKLFEFVGKRFFWWLFFFWSRKRREVERIFALLKVLSLTYSLQKSCLFFSHSSDFFVSLFRHLRMSFNDFFSTDIFLLPQSALKQWPDSKTIKISRLPRKIPSS